MCFIIIFFVFFYTVTKAESLKIHNVTSDELWGFNSGFDFKSPPHWKHLLNTDCGGQRQSPIDIKTENVIFEERLHPIVIRDINHINDSTTLERHFSSLYLLFNKNYKISFGDEHCLAPVSLHWHWGSDNSKGSEHTLNGRQFPIEGHLLSYNCDKFKSIDNAIGSVDGLYVIGFFYKIGQPNHILSRIIDSMDPLINTEQNSVSIDEIHPKHLLPLNLSRYYRYAGSLTTPPCTENVIWTIMDDVHYISNEQLNVFRQLKFGAPEKGYMVNNFRPINTLHFKNRVVYASFRNGNSKIKNAKFLFIMVLCSVLSI